MVVQPIFSAYIREHWLPLVCRLFIPSLVFPSPLLQTIIGTMDLDAWLSTNTDLLSTAMSKTKYWPRAPDGKLWIPRSESALHTLYANQGYPSATFYAEYWPKTTDGKPWVPPLFAAMDDGNIALIHSLIKQGADVNQPSKVGRTPLNWALELRMSWDIVKELLRWQPRLDIPTGTSDGHTALHIAVANEMIGAYKIGLLLANCTKVKEACHVRDAKRKTVLDYVDELGEACSKLSDRKNYRIDRHKALSAMFEQYR